MMELLRKFEEESLAQDEEGEEEDGGEGGGDLEAAELEDKLRGVDLGEHRQRLRWYCNGDFELSWLT